MGYFELLLSRMLILRTGLGTAYFSSKTHVHLSFYYKPLCITQKRHEQFWWQRTRTFFFKNYFHLIISFLKKIYEAAEEFPDFLQLVLIKDVLYFCWVFILIIKTNAIVSPVEGTLVK